VTCYVETSGKVHWLFRREEQECSLGGTIEVRAQCHACTTWNTLSAVVRVQRARLTANAIYTVERCIVPALLKYGPCKHTSHGFCATQTWHSYIGRFTDEGAFSTGKDCRCSAAVGTTNCLCRACRSWKRSGGEQRWSEAMHVESSQWRA
jgi:hypothetical protein